MKYYNENLVINAELEIEARIKEIYKFYEKGTLIWQTKLGKKMLISEMTNKHIENTISFLINEKLSVNEDAYHIAIIDILKTELKKRNKIDFLIDFLLHLNNKGLINNHDFDYEKEVKWYVTLLASKINK